MATPCPGSRLNMFVLFPFISSHGGWVEKYNSNGVENEIALCKGWQMAFDLNNPRSHRVWN